MIRGGTGGAKTQTGLIFEGRVSLKEKFKSTKDYKVTNNIIYYKGKKVAELFKKYKLHSILLKRLGIDSKVLISKKLLPDETILVHSNKTLYIVEMKFQRVAGSVDEKLQTCDFKLKQYKKMFHGTGISVKYVYILNDWFKKPEYKDTLDYIKSVNCKYFFNKIPFDFLGLPNPEK